MGSVSHSFLANTLWYNRTNLQRSCGVLLILAISAIATAAILYYCNLDTLGIKEWIENNPRVFKNIVLLTDFFTILFVLWCSLSSRVVQITNNPVKVTAIDRLLGRLNLKRENIPRLEVTKHRFKSFDGHTRTEYGPYYTPQYLRIEENEMDSPVMIGEYPIKDKKVEFLAIKYIERNYVVEKTPLVSVLTIFAYDQVRGTSLNQEHLLSNHNLSYLAEDGTFVDKEFFDALASGTHRKYQLFSEESEVLP
jgi:hypothetical protein